LLGEPECHLKVVELSPFATRLLKSSRTELCPPIISRPVRTGAKPALTRQGSPEQPRLFVPHRWRF